MKNVNLLRCDLEPNTIGQLWNKNPSAQYESGKDTYLSL